MRIRIEAASALFLAVLAVFHATASGQTSAETQHPPGNPAWADRPSLLRLLQDNTKAVVTSPLRWDARTWAKFAAGAGAVGIAMLGDEAIQREVARDRGKTLERIVDHTEPFGSDYSWLLMGGFYGAGRLFGDHRATAVAEDGLIACIVASGVVAPSLRMAAGRTRPSPKQGADEFGTGGASFPSGHVTQAFAMASVIAAHYDSRWIDVFAYGVAATVGVARIQHGAHFASDVLAAALIGSAVGRSIVRMNGERRIEIVPIASEGGAGLGLRLNLD